MSILNICVRSTFRAVKYFFLHHADFLRRLQPPMEELKDNPELKARTIAQKRFLLWPKEKENKEGKHERKNKKASSMAVRFNKIILAPLVGYASAESNGKLGQVPFLEAMLEQLNEAWSVT